jgi:murein DD-endopeptidase MepM/ murein hydrolase activator NlpD
MRRAGIVALALLALLSGGAPVAGHAEPAVAAPRVHVVKPGETLGSIARKYGVSHRALTAANRLPRRSALLRVGRTLTIPARPVPTAERATSSGTPRPGVSARSGVAPRAAPVRRVTSRVPVERVRLTPPINLMLGIPTLDPTVPPFVWPVEGTVSSTFGRRRMGWHRGLDIQAELGTPVIASAPGLVVASGVEPRYGRVVKIEHEAGFVTVYAHNHVNTVDVGDRVAAGQVIASTGQTGRATSPHLHFDIRRDGAVVNPPYLLPMPRRVAVDESLDHEPDDDE